MLSPLTAPLNHDFNDEFTLDDFENALDYAEATPLPATNKRKFATVPPINVELTHYDEHAPAIRPQIITPKVNNNTEIYSLLNKQNQLIQKLMEEIEAMKEDARIKEDRIVTLFYNYRHRIVKLEENCSHPHKK
jgi:hypothetical protein